jgi:hypothetical protein
MLPGTQSSLICNFVCHFCLILIGLVGTCEIVKLRVLLVRDLGGLLIRLLFRQIEGLQLYLGEIITRLWLILEFMVMKSGFQL